MQLVSLLGWWSMKNPVQDFCYEKGLSDNLTQAFLSYCKSMYASRYMMKANGDTISKFVSEMTGEQVLDAWNNFISDMKNIMPTTLA